MAVEINIDLNSKKAHGKIQALRADLKSLNDEVNLDFDTDGDLKAKIQQLTNELKDIDIDVDYSDLERAAALKAALQGDIDSNIDLNTEGIGDTNNNGKDPPGSDPRFSRFMERFKKFGTQTRGGDGTFRSKSYFRDFLDERRSGSLVGSDYTPRSRISNMKNIMGERSSGAFAGRGRTSRFIFKPEFDPNMGGGSGGSGGFGDLFGGREVFNGQNTRRSSKMFRGIKKRLKGLIPSMNTFYNLLAAIIPILVVFVAQALGVAAAMGAVAVAGASIVALGLVGHGEDMASSWEKAKEQLSNLKKEMFETFQPTMQTFAPIQERVFDALPGMLQPVASAMESLTVYSDTLFASLRGLTDWIAGGFRGMAAMEDQISELALRFGEILGRNIGAFFKWLIVEAYQSQEMLIKLGAAFRDLAIGAYNFVKIIVRVLMALRPLAGLFAWLGNLLNNKVVIAILTFATVLGVTVYSVVALTGVISGLVSLMSVGLIEILLSSVAALDIMIFRTIAATISNYGLASSIATVVSWATLGIGALIAMGAAAKAVDGIQTDMKMTKSAMGGAGGGYTGGSTGGGVGSGTTQTVINEGDTYNMEVNGNPDNKTEKGLEDIVASENSTYETRDTTGYGDN